MDEMEKKFELRKHLLDLNIENLMPPDVDMMPSYKMRCYACIYGGSEQGKNLIWCKERHSRVNTNEALSCEKYEQLIDKQLKSEHGKLFAYLQEEDYRCKSEWETLGYMIKNGEKGIEMHSAPYGKSNGSYYITEYFLPEQVTKATYMKKCRTCTKIKGCEKFKQQAKGMKKFPCDDYEKAKSPWEF